MKQDKTVSLNKSGVLPFVEMRKASRSTACYHAHSHDEFSFGVIDSGSAQYKNLNRKNYIGSGNTVTINPGDIHSCNPCSADWSYRMLFVDTHWVGQLQSEMLSLENVDYHSFANLHETDRRFYNDFHILFETLMNESSSLEAESILIQYLESCFLTKKIHARRPNKHCNTNINRVRDKLFDQLQTNHKLSDLAEEAGLSRYHLIRSFKQRYGMPPHALQLDERIKKSKFLLQSGCTMAETSTQLGFSDQSHFQRNFKKRLAITPGQYQSFFI